MASRTAVAYYRTSSATNVGQVGIRQKTTPDPPFLADGSLARPVLSAESTQGLRGWWGKLTQVNGETQKVYIGPMTREQMLEQDETYRHIFRDTDPAKDGYDKDSLIRQQEAVRKCAASRGLRIVHEYYDAAVKGGDPVDARPGFGEMLTYMLGNGARTIIVENAGRFARDLVVQETGYAMLKARGIELIAADAPDSFLDDTPTAVLIRQILGAVHQFDKAMLVQKLRGARDRKSRAQGERIEGNPRWKALRNPAAIEAARAAKERGLSLRAIAAELAGKGLCSASGKVYGPESIKRMLGAP